MSEFSNLDAQAYMLTGSAGLIGRLMLHARMVQQGKRKPVSWALLLDLPIALGMGWGIYGVGVWLNLPLEAELSAAIAAAYLGPYAVDRLFSLLSEKYFGKSDD